MNINRGKKASGTLNLGVWENRKTSMHKHRRCPKITTQIKPTPVKSVNVCIEKEVELFAVDE